MKRYKRNALISLVLVFVFMALASGFNSAWGSVSIKDLYYPNANGTRIHAQLFVPSNVDADHPGPAILNMHGGSDYLQTVSNYSIELARRGYIVLAVDAYGSGDSDYVKGVATNAGASDIDHESALIMDGGASTGLEQMMSWPFVDQDNIGLIGHSMGGTYIANAALSHADHVKAIMPWGSGSFVDMMRNHKSSDFPFDVGYINANSDEMVSFALKGKPNQLFDDESLKAFIGTDDPIEPGKTYGSFEDGTARVIYNPSTTHIGNIICKDSIKSIIDFFSEAIPTGSNLSSSNQVWMYKELFCILGIIALISFIVNYSMVLVLTPYFADIQNQTLPELKVNPATRIISFVLCLVIPILTLHKLGLIIAAKIKPNVLYPMNWANNLALLAVANSIILLIVFLIIKKADKSMSTVSAGAFGLTGNSGKVEIKQILKSLTLSVIIVFTTYFIVNLCYYIFHIDIRFWQFGLMPITIKRIKYLPSYVVMYLFAIGILNLFGVICARLNVQGQTKTEALMQYLQSLLIGAGGYLIVLIIYYAGLKINHLPPFFFGYPPFLDGHPNSLVFSMKTTVLVPTFAILSIINTFLFQRTKNGYLGWFITALLATMILITTNAFAI